MIVLILLLSLMLRLPELNQSFWLDEAAQVIESARPLSEQLHISGDFQPPLFHLLLHFWMQVSTSEAWIRFLSVIFGVLTVYMFYKLAGILFSQKIAQLSALLLAISPFHIWYSQEARPYALAAFLGVLATYFFLRKKFGVYTLIVILLLYSMYVAPFLLFGHFVVALVYFRKHLVRWFISLITAFIFFIPWLPAFITQLGIGSGLRFTLPGWSEAVSAGVEKAIPLVLVKFLIGRITFDNKIIYLSISLLLGILIVTTFWNALKKNTLSRIPFILLCFPLFAVFGIHLFLPILAPQRVLFLLPFLLIILSVGILSLKKFIWVPLLFMTVISTFTLVEYATNPRFQKEKWREAVQYVETTSTLSAKAIFVFPDAFAPWLWYSTNTTPYLAVAPTFTVKETELPAYRAVLAESNKVYYFHYLTELTDPSHIFINYLKELGFTETKTTDFPGVGFVTEYEKLVALY